MNVFRLTPILLFLLTSTIAATQGSTHRVEIEPIGNEQFAGAAYTIWVPEGLEKVERIILHQHGCGKWAQTAGRSADDDLHWRMLARRTNSALMGSSLWPKGECGDWADPQRGTERAYFTALDELAASSGHPEIATVNWIVWGHSGGASWTLSMFKNHPDRFEAAILQSGGRPDRVEGDTSGDTVLYATDIPLMIHTGAGEFGHVRFNDTYHNAINFFELMRGFDAPATLVIDPASAHGNGNSRYITIPWIEAVVMAKDDAAVQRPTEFSDHYDSWFPDQVVAAKWQQFVKQGSVPDFTPPETAPFDVEARHTGLGVTLTWAALPDWESGIKTFRIYRDGELLPPYSTPHRFEGTTEIFHELTGSDTPRAPLSMMEYEDINVEPGATHTYRISQVNYAGLESAKSEAVEFVYR